MVNGTFGNWGVTNKVVIPQKDIGLLFFFRDLVVALVHI